MSTETFPDDPFAGFFEKASPSAADCASAEPVARHAQSIPGVLARSTSGVTLVSPSVSLAADTPARPTRLGSPVDAQLGASARPTESGIHVGVSSLVSRPACILDPGLCLTLRPMRYPAFFEMYRAGIKNTWTVEEVDFSTDVADLNKKMTSAERHLVHRLVAFFATGDSIVANNLVLNLYKHINAPEARMYLSRQLYEEALHVQFYLTLLDTYVPDPVERCAAFAAVENIPSIQRKAGFCMRWLDQTSSIERIERHEHRRQFLLNLICFATCIEGLFFFGAFAYVYFLRSKGLLHGLAAGTNWVFRDESAHMAFAFEVVDTVRREEPELFDAEMEASVAAMLDEAIACEVQFAEDLLGRGVAGLSLESMRQYLQFCADQRLATLRLPKRYGVKNPFVFMELQDVQEVANFFERRVSAYQVGVSGEVALDASF
jgi:ribonucleoside-diphosphate reductase beta chain